MKSSDRARLMMPIMITMAEAMMHQEYSPRARHIKPKPTPSPSPEIIQQRLAAAQEKRDRKKAKRVADGRAQ